MAAAAAAAGIGGDRVAVGAIGVEGEIGEAEAAAAEEGAVAGGTCDNY